MRLGNADIPRATARRDRDLRHEVNVAGVLNISGQKNKSNGRWSECDDDAGETTIEERALYATIPIMTSSRSLAKLELALLPKRS